MSATLYALVVLQGTTLTFSPGYTTAAECMQQYKGPYVSCFAYDPSGVTWTAFFKTPAGGFGSVWRFPNESACQNYVNALRPEAAGACRQLAHPEPCSVACIKPLEPPPAAKPVPQAPEPDTAPKPDPASTETKPSDIQVGGKQYTKVTGLTWIDKEPPPDSFADVSVGPNDLQSKDKPSLPPKTDTRRVAAPKSNSLVQGYNHAPQPVQGFIDVVMLPWDFLTYPGTRDW